jgi:hypothetical protein
MRIAILTLPLHTNYGGILQAYALQTVLQRMGHDVTLLDKESRTRNPWWHFPLSLAKRCLKKYVLRDKDTILFLEHKLNKEAPVVRQNIDRFINVHFPNRMIYQHIEKDIHSGMFDAIIVGSDQIWRPVYYPQISHAYLDFTQKWHIKRIAYAVSFGTDLWEYTSKQTKRCKLLVQNFSGVSVREESGVDLCRQYLNIPTKLVLDPTMLLNSEDYLQLCSDKDYSLERKGQVLAYILDMTDDKKNFLNNISCQLGLSNFSVNNSSSENVKLPVEERIVPSVEQWLQGFSQAKYVVTDSFHGCVLSILFHKPFWVYANKGRGLSRFQSLLSMLHLENRLFYSSEDIKDSNHHFVSSVKWSEVDCILLKMRKKSFDFLIENLN